MKKKIILTIFATTVACAFLSGIDSYALTTVSSPAEIATAIMAGETSFKLGQDFTALAQIQVPAGKAYTIDGDGHRIIRSSSMLAEIFTVPQTSTLTLTNLTIDGGAPGWVAHTEIYEPRPNADGLARNYGMYPVTVESSDVIANAPIISNNGTVSLNNVTIRDAISSGNASGIENNGNLSIKDSTFNHNHNTTGEFAGVIYNASASANITIDNSKFANNNSGKNVLGSYYCNGSAVMIYDANDVLITNSEFDNNSAIMNGAGVMLQAANTATLSNNTFTNNKSGNDGAALFIGSLQNYRDHVSDVVYLNNNTFKNNLGLTMGHENGNAEGAVVSYGFNFKKIVINGGSFIGNRASFDSALALYWDEPATNAQNYGPRSLESVEISNVTFDGNQNENKYGGVIAAIHGIDSAKVSNITYQNNCGRFRIQNIKNINIDGFNASSNTAANTALHVATAERASVKNIESYDNEVSNTNAMNFFGSVIITGIDDLEVENLTAKRNVGGKGAGLVITNRTREQSNVTLKNIDLENNTSSIAGGGMYLHAMNPMNIVAENVVATGNESAIGGGVYVEASSTHNIKFTGDSKIYLNSATEAADDVAYYIPDGTENASSLGSLKLPVASAMRIGGVDGWYHDAANARYSAENAIEQVEVTLSSANSYYLKAANGTGAEITGPIEDKANNPATGDLSSIALLVLAISIVAGCGFVHYNARRR